MRIAGVASVAVELPYVPRKVIVPVEPLIFPSFVTFSRNVTSPPPQIIVPSFVTFSPNVTVPSEAVIFPLFVTVPVNCAGCEPSLISPELSVVPPAFRVELFVCISSVLFALVFNVPFILNVPLTLSTDVVPSSGSITLLNVVAFVNLRVCPVAELNTTVPPFAVNVVYEKSASEEKYVLPEDAVRIAGVASVAVELPYVPRKVILPVEPLIFPSFVTFPLNVTAPLLPVIVPLLVTVDLNSAVPSVPIIVPPAKTVTAPLYDCVPAVTAPPSETVVSPYTVNEVSCALNVPFTVQFEETDSVPTESVCAVSFVFICEFESFPSVTVCAAPPEFAISDEFA